MKNKNFLYIISLIGLVGSCAALVVPVVILYSGVRSLDLSVGALLLGLTSGAWLMMSIYALTNCKTNPRKTAIRVMSIITITMVVAWVVNYALHS